MVGLRPAVATEVAHENASKGRDSGGAFKHVFPPKGRDASPLAAGDLERALGKVLNEAVWKPPFFLAFSGRAKFFSSAELAKTISAVGCGGR